MHYGAELARIHHDRFGMVARGAARALVARLSKGGISSGTVVDLAAGSGILARYVSEAGFRAWGVDISHEMLRIARAEAPSATFVEGSLWNATLPSCVAVAAVGEAMSYATDPASSLSALEERLAAIHRALAPGGLLLFDVASPGRSGPSGSRSVFWSHEGEYLGMQEREDAPSHSLTRVITVFLPEGDGYRRVEETHLLRLYRPEDVESALGRTGFEWERLERYDDFDFLPGWSAWAATKARAG